MNTCMRCEGFAPPSLACCPHCDAPIHVPSGPSAVAGAVKKVGQIAAAAAAAVTLMACYGAPGGEYVETYVPTTSITTACDNVEDLLLDETLTDDTYTQGASDAVQPSCASLGGSERIYRFVAPSAGSLHFEWQADHAVTVVVRQVCEGSAELLCEPPSTAAAIDVPLVDGEAIFIVVDGSEATLFDFTASFAPS